MKPKTRQLTKKLSLTLTCNQYSILKRRQITSGYDMANYLRSILMGKEKPPLKG